VTSPPTVVVGAGAAGLVAAFFASDHGHPVVIIESTADGGRKILISGGGRCNILPEALEPRRFVSESDARLVQRLLRSWPLKGQRAFFERDVGIPLSLEADSRKWFPASNRARDVRDGLVALARRAGVEFQFNTQLLDLRANGSGWRLETSRGPIDSGAVILATGGLSVPATGSTGVGLRIARTLGHVVRDTYPALTPLVCAVAAHAHLAGVSLPVRLRATSSGCEARADGGFLFTHRGYSGPAVLDVSHVCVRSLAAEQAAVVRVSWATIDAESWHRQFLEYARGSANGLALTPVARAVPQRLAEQLFVEAGVPLNRRASELRREERAALVRHLTDYVLPWSGDEGYTKAEVTGGGVSLDEVDPGTLESRRCARLFLCGEMLDAFGPIGGHNFAWAWATGRLAGLGARARAMMKMNG
jgi:predicted Rossmann fold flavoprotein